MILPEIFIVILNWNGKSDTLMCLNSLKSLQYYHYKIIVVDNGSTDGSVSEIETSFPYLFIIETGQNLGYAEGNNVGIRYAIEHDADYILLLNNDTTVAPDLLDQLVLDAIQNPDVGILGATLFYMDRPENIWFAGAKWNERSLVFENPYQDQKQPDCVDTTTDYACGAALFFSADVAKAIGLLDPRFFLVFEESDWCFRAKRAGYSCKIVPNAHVWHKVGASFDGENSPLREYFDFRNRLLWAEKNLPPKDLFRLIKKSFISIFPQFAVSKSGNAPFNKRLVWSMIGWKNNWFSPILRAKRRGLIDYLFRNFGDCPESIRIMNKEYSEEGRHRPN